MTSIPQITLRDGATIPQLGFGVFLIDPEDTAEAVAGAAAAGYRHFDTAQMYGNEAGVAAGLAEAGLRRDEVFLTTKLANPNHLPDDARRSFDKSLTALGTDHVDLFLIHWPLPTRYDGDFVTTWKVLEEFAADGRARSIGVSNFQIPHLQKLMAETSTVPAVNQIEVHPYHPNDEVRAFCAAHEIVVQAWSPLARGALLTDPVVTDIAAQVSRTPAQVLLRWAIQRGDVIFPKSVTPARMAENAALFDFALDAEQMAALAGLDRGPAGRIGPDPDVFDAI